MGKLFSKETIIILYFRTINIPNDITWLILNILNCLTTRIIYHKNQNTLSSPSTKLKYNNYPLDLDYSDALRYARLFDFIMTHQGNCVTKTIKRKDNNFENNSTKHLVCRYRKNKVFGSDYYQEFMIMNIPTNKITIFVDIGKNSFNPDFIFTNNRDWDIYKKTYKPGGLKLSIHPKDVIIDPSLNLFTLSGGDNNISVSSNFKIVECLWLDKNTISFCV